MLLCQQKFVNALVTGNLFVGPVPWVGVLIVHNVSMVGKFEAIWGVNRPLLAWGGRILVLLTKYVVPGVGELTFFFQKILKSPPHAQPPPPPSSPGLDTDRCIILNQSVGSLLIQYNTIQTLMALLKRAFNNAALWCLSSVPHISYKSTTFQVNSLQQEISCHHSLKNWKSVLLPVKRNTNVGNAGT